MPLIVTGTIGIDTIHTPHGSAEEVLGGSCTHFAAAASFFTAVRVVAVVGDDFHEDYQAVFARFPNVDVDGLEIRAGSKTFRWGARYHEDMNQRDTLFTELGVLAEHPPNPPASYADSRFVFLANSHPTIQRELLASFPQRVIGVADTMNLWIDTERAELLRLLHEIDGLLLNDEESRMLTGKRNPITAGREILKLGPTFVVVKKGEHGAILVHRDGISVLPAYPIETVVDPTGAGDTFAGGMMGYLAAAHSKDASIQMASIQQAIAHGTVIASFTVEKFSLDRLAEISREQVAHRFSEFAEMVSVGEAILSES